VGRESILYLRQELVKEAEFLIVDPPTLVNIMHPNHMSHRGQREVQIAFRERCLQLHAIDLSSAIFIHRTEPLANRMVVGV